MKNARSSILSRIPLIFLMVWTVVLVASCEEKDLVFAGESIDVKVEFDWRNAPEATPEGMTLIFFPADGKSLSWRFDISEREGGEIELLSGVYNVIAFNNDLPGVEFSNTANYDLFSATARSVSDILTSPTGMLYSARCSEVALFPVDGHPGIITLKPDSLSTVYHICLDSVTGTERIKTANAVINGLARSVNLRLQRNSAETCSLYTPLHISSVSRGKLESVTTGFGIPDIPDPNISLEVIVTTSHGKYSKSFDITDQIMNSKHSKDVYIHIDGLDIPAADTPTDPDGNPDVGISVGVDGWQLIEVIYS